MVQLHFILMHTVTEVVALLLNRGAIVNVLKKNNLSALYGIAEEGHQGALSFLMSTGAVQKHSALQLVP